MSYVRASWLIRARASELTRESVMTPRRVFVEKYVLQKHTSMETLAQECIRKTKITQAFSSVEIFFISFVHGFICLSKLTRQNLRSLTTIQLFVCLQLLL